MKNLFLATLTGVVCLTSGCATQFTCGAFPEAGCQPVSDVYEKSNDGFHDYRKDLFKKEKGTKSSSTKAKWAGDDKGPTKEEKPYVRVGQAHQTLNYVSPGDVILTKPVTMRILINSWEDEAKDLNAGGFVYVRLRDAEWVTN